jgi:hypothetical protein
VGRITIAQAIYFLLRVLVPSWYCTSYSLQTILVVLSCYYLVYYSTVLMVYTAKRRDQSLHQPTGMMHLLVFVSSASLFFLLEIM